MRLLFSRRWSRKTSVTVSPTWRYAAIRRCHKVVDCFHSAGCLWARFFTCISDPHLAAWIKPRLCVGVIQRARPALTRSLLHTWRRPRKPGGSLPCLQIDSNSGRGRATACDKLMDDVTLMHHCDISASASPPPCSSLPTTHTRHLRGGCRSTYGYACRSGSELHLSPISFICT